MTDLTSRRITILTAALACTTFLVLPNGRVCAQVSAGSDKASSGAARQPTDEIVVTAEKRAQPVKDVPLSISVIGGADLLTNHIDSYDDITRVTPGVSFIAGSGVGSESLSIRGISSIVGSSTVGEYLDEVPTTLQNLVGTWTPILFDIDRIEILRGPQGTLYGAGSESGTFRFITIQPDTRNTTALVSSDQSGTKYGSLNYEGRGVLNISLIPNKLAFRAGVLYGDQDGWITQYAHSPTSIRARTDQVLATHTNAVNNRVGKLALKWNVTDTITAIASAIYQREHQDDAPNYFLGEGLFNQSKVIKEPATDRVIIPSLTVSDRFGFATLTSITSFFFRKYNSTRDATYFDPDFVVPTVIDHGTYTASRAAIANTTLAFNPTMLNNMERNHVFTQEARLTSGDEKLGNIPITWTVGVYYSNNIDRLAHTEPSPGFSALFQSIYGFDINDPVRSPVSIPGNPGLWAGDDFYFNLSRRGVETIAGYGQLNATIFSKLHAEAGLRYQRAKLTYQKQSGGYLDEGDIQAANQVTHDHAFTPKFSLLYDLNDRSTLYGTISKGYRDGGVNEPVPATTCGPYLSQVGLTGQPDPNYNPDSLWNYEVGTKIQAFDRALKLNASVYNIEWSNIQQQITIPGCDFGFLQNIGKARARGLEVEARLAVPFIRGLTLGASGGYENTKVTQAGVASPAQVGEHLLYSPEWTATPFAEYTGKIRQGLSFYIRGDVELTGRSYGSFAKNSTTYLQSSYRIVDAGAGVQFSNGINIELYGKNLGNDHTIIKQPRIAGINEVFTVTPETIGLRVSVPFDLQ